jgi:hypothetical protein
MERKSTQYIAQIGTQPTTITVWVDEVTKKADIKASDINDIINIRKMSTADINSLIAVLQDVNAVIQDPLSIQVSVSQATLGENDGVINISILGGVAPYVIEWSNGYSNVQEISELNTGTYSVIVTDYFGTTSSKTMYV